MSSKKLYFWQALLIIYVIPVIALTILVSCVDSPRFTSIMNKLASTDNYPSLISNLIDFGVIIFAFIHYYRLPLALGGGWNAVKPQRGQFILLCLVGVFDILVFESFAVIFAYLSLSALSDSIFCDIIYNATWSNLNRTHIHSSILNKWDCFGLPIL